MSAGARSLALALAVAGGLGCAEETSAGVRPGAGRGPAEIARTKVVREPAAPATPARERPGFRQNPPASGRPSSGSAPGGGGGAAGGGESEERREDPDRRLREALVRAFGDPSACLSEATRDRIGESLTVNVTVRVTPTGRPVDAQVSGGGLSPEDLACMTRRAEGLRLPGPIENAPRTVSAAIEYQVHDTRTAETERTLPDPGLHPGTLQPDRTLPAAGTVEDRPRGFVSPGRTLPAVNERRNPPGYVPPASTLPALGE